MDNIIRIPKSVFSNQHTVTYTKMDIENKFRSDLAELNVYHFTKGSGFFISPSLMAGGFKSYFVHRGCLQSVDTGELLSAGDAIVMLPGEDYIHFEAIEDSQVIVHAINTPAYDEVTKNAKYIAVCLTELQNKDHYTKSHSDRVCKLVQRMAIKLGYKSAQYFHLYQAARYHDLGKIYIPDVILNKEGPLTNEEYDLMKSHVTQGEMLLKGIFPEEVYRIIHQHHERIDGTGYPEGLIDEELSEGGKLLGICDSFDAMVTDRVYKKGKSSEESLLELKRLAGVKYDLRLTHLFVEMIQSEDEEKVIFI